MGELHMMPRADTEMFRVPDSRDDYITAGIDQLERHANGVQGYAAAGEQSAAPTFETPRPPRMINPGQRDHVLSTDGRFIAATPFVAEHQHSAETLSPDDAALLRAANATTRWLLQMRNEAINPLTEPSDADANQQHWSGVIATTQREAA